MTPCFVRIDQQIEERRPLRGAVARVEVSPLLLVVRRWSPSRGLEERVKLVIRKRLPAQRPRGPAVQDQLLDGVVGFAMLGDVMELAGDGWWHMSNVYARWSNLAMPESAVGPHRASDAPSRRPRAVRLCGPDPPIAPKLPRNPCTEEPRTEDPSRRGVPLCGVVRGSDWIWGSEAHGPCFAPVVTVTHYRSKTGIQAVRGRPTRGPCASEERQRQNGKSRPN